MLSWLWPRKDRPRGQPPKVIEPLKPQSVKHGSRTVLETTVKGNPTPRVLWYHLEDEILPSQEFVQEYDATTGRAALTIGEVFIDDTGLYRCLAVNQHGQDETATYLTVEDLEILEKQELRQAPRITFPLQAQVIKKSSPLVLQANFEAFPPPTVKWYHQGKELKPSLDYKIENLEDETTLCMEEVFEDDTGEYEVKIFNEVGEARSVATVIVTQPEETIEMEPPMFIKPLVPQIIPEGEVAFLEAEVTSKPEADFTWFRHGQKITADEELEVQITSGDNKSSLVLGELFEDDSGDYTVTAQNPIGRASSTATLLVEGEGAEEAEPPAFNPPLTPLRVMDGDEVRFSCRVTGNPKPRLLWLQNGRPIGHHREMQVTQTPDGHAGLEISEVFPEDAGDYTCIARNKAGEARTTANLAVESYEYQQDSEVATVTSVSDKAVLSISEEEETEEVDKGSESDTSEAGSSPFFITRLAKVVEVKEGSPVSLITKATGYPKPTIKWHVDNTPVEVTENVALETYEDGTSVLNIPHAVLDDCGEYTCEALNRNGVDTTVTTVVVLQEHTEESKAYRKPDWVTRMEDLKQAMTAEHTKPQFTEEIVNTHVKEMETITFTTTFAGNPKPEISWYHNNKLIRQHASYQMRVRNDKAMLTVVQARPEMRGEYTCRAVNSEGETFTKATLEVTELTFEEKLKVDDERYAAVHIQHAAELMREKERERAVKMRQEHHEAIERLKVEKQERSVQLEKELEEAKKKAWKPLTERKEVKVYKSVKERCVAEVYSNWKAPMTLEERYPEIQPSEFAPNQIPGVKCFVKVSETSVKGEEVVKEIAPQFFEDQQVITELARIHTLLKSSIKVSEIWSMFRAGEFKSLLQPKIQPALVKICEHIGHHRNVSIVLAQETQEQAKKHPVGLKAFLRMVKHAKNIKPDALFKEIVPREMGMFSSTTQELTKVSQMLNQGIETEEIIACCEAGKLPALKKPETQQPLINMVEKHGHSVMVAQVLVEEAYREAKYEQVTTEEADELIHEEEEKKKVRVTKVKSKPPLTLLKETPQQILVPEGQTDSLQIASLPTSIQAQVSQEEARATLRAEVTQVHTELCVPGFKALIRLATDNQVDLETVELKPLEKTTFAKDIGKLSFHLKKGVQVNELMTMIKENEFVSLKQPKHQAQLLEVADRLGHATVHKVLVQEAADRCDDKIGLKSVMRTIQQGKESMEQVILSTAKEFGPASEPVKEMAAVGYLLQEGVKCDEVMTLVESGLLSSLKMPQAQVPLTSMVADKGHIGSICEVLVEESVREVAKPRPKGEAARMTVVKEILKKAKAEMVDVKTFAPEMVPGVKAYVRMAQEESVSIEEVVQKAKLEPKVKEEMAKIGMMVKHGVLAQDVLTLMEAGEFPQLMREEAQAELLTVIEEFGFRALINEVVLEQVQQAIQKTGKPLGVKSFMRMMEQANVNVEEIITEKFPKELEADLQPVCKEMAKVSVMLKEGVQAQEIMSMIEAGELPSLQRPEAQVPLVNMVGQEGHTAIVCQVLIEDSLSSIIQELPKVDKATISSVETLESATETQVEVKVTSRRCTQPT